VEAERRRGFSGTQPALCTHRTSSTRGAPHAPSTDFHYGKSCGVGGKNRNENITIHSSIPSQANGLRHPKRSRKYRWVDTSKEPLLRWPY
jgi:hypothetical protein